MSTARLYALICALGLISAGCEVSSEESAAVGDAFLLNPALSNVPPPPPQCFADRFIQPPAEISRKIDILFVIDTSGSLDEERAGISQGIDAFVAALPAQVDYQIAVELAHSSRSTYSGKLYKQSTEPHVLKSSAMSLADIRAALINKLTRVRTDSYADGGEEGLYATFNLLKPENVAIAQSQGFFRNDAALAVVFVSDEQDICFDYPADITPVFDGDRIEPVAKARDCAGISPATVLQKLKDLQGDRPLLVSAIAYNDKNTYPRFGENEYGYGWIDVARLGQGVVIDLANPHYQEGLQTIGTLATQRLNLQSSFVLSHANVDPATIKSYTDGVQGPFNYVSETYSLSPIELGGANSVIDVTYCEKSTNIRVSETCQAGSFVPKAQIKVGLSSDPNEGSMTIVQNGFQSLGHPATVYTDEQIAAGQPTLDGVTVLATSRKVVISPINQAYIQGVKNFITAGGSVMGEYDGAALFMSDFRGDNEIIANMTPPLNLFTGIAEGGGLILPLGNARVYVTDPFDPIMQGVPADFLLAPRAAFALSDYDGDWLHASATYVSTGAGDIPAGSYPAIMSGRCGPSRVVLFTMNHFQVMTQTPVRQIILNSLNWATGR